MIFVQSFSVIPSCFYHYCFVQIYNILLFFYTFENDIEQTQIWKEHNTLFFKTSGSLCKQKRNLRRQEIELPLWPTSGTSETTANAWTRRQIIQHYTHLFSFCVLITEITLFFKNHLLVKLRINFKIIAITLFSLRLKLAVNFHEFLASLVYSYIL